VRLPLIRRADGDSPYALAVLACQDHSCYVALLLHRIPELPGHWGPGRVLFSRMDRPLPGSPQRWLNDLGWASNDALTVEWSEFYISYQWPLKESSPAFGVLGANDTMPPWLPVWVLDKVQKYGFVLEGDPEITGSEGQRGYYPFGSSRNGGFDDSDIGKDLDAALKFTRSKPGSQSNSAMDDMLETFIIQLRVHVDDEGLIEYLNDLRASISINQQQEVIPQVSTIATWPGGWQEFGDENRRVRVTFSLWNTPEDLRYTMVDIDLFGTVYTDFLDSVD
jgi:hypothetical protein